MTLSIELIAQSMEKFGGELLLAQDRQFEFSKIQMLSPEAMDELCDDVLYVCEPKMLYKLPKGRFQDHCFVFRARTQQLERCKSFLNAIVYDGTFMLSDVINHLLNLFLRMNSLEQEMKQMIWDGGNYNNLIDASKKMFPDSSLLLVDSAYNVIAATHEATDKNEHVNRILQQRFYDRDDLDRMAAMGYFDIGSKYLHPVLVVPPNICGCPVMLRSYHENGAFFSFVSCYFFDHVPTLSEQRLFKCLTEQLDSYYRTSGFYDHSLPKRQQMIDDLIKKKNPGQDFLRDRCRALKIPQQGNFRLGYIRLGQNCVLKASHVALQFRAWCNIPNYGAFQYNDSVIILFRDWHSYEIVEQTGFKDNWNSMVDIVKANNGVLGISLLFTNISKFSTAFSQAESAIDVGQLSDPRGYEYHYSRYYLDDMLNCYGKKYDLSDVYVQYLDALADESGGSYSNLLLLYHYICSERNISLTAKKVHMHRNSIIYRLQKIQDMLELDLDNPQVRLRLMISFKIMISIGKLHLDTGNAAPDAEPETQDAEHIKLVE